MIEKLSMKKGDKKQAKVLLSNLENLNPTDKYRRYKAAGSIGGSVTHGYLKKINENGIIFFETTR